MAAKSKGPREDSSRGQSNRRSGDEQRNMDTPLNRESSGTSDDLEDLRNTSTSGFASIEADASTEDDLDIEKSDLENLEDEDLEDLDIDEDADEEEGPYEDQYEDDEDEDADETKRGTTGARGMDV